MVTSPYEWKILEWDEIPQTNKQAKIHFDTQYTRIQNQDETNIPTLYHEFNISEQIRINEQIKAKPPGMFADIRAHLCAKTINLFYLNILKKLKTIKYAFAAFILDSNIQNWS